MKKTESPLQTAVSKEGEGGEALRNAPSEPIDVDKLFDAVGAELELAKRRANFAKYVRNMGKMIRLILIRIEKFEELCQYERSGYLHPEVLQQAGEKFKKRANRSSKDW